jgi:hypothetical protein
MSGIVGVFTSFADPTEELLISKWQLRGLWNLEFDICALLPVRVWDGTACLRYASGEWLSAQFVGTSRMNSTVVTGKIGHPIIKIVGEEVERLEAKIKI